MRHLNSIGYMGWVLLSEVLRDSDVLNNRLSWGSSLGWSLDDLWAHKLVFKDLLAFSHSSCGDLDEFLEAHESDCEEDE